MSASDLFVHGGTLVREDRVEKGAVWIRDGRIAGVGPDLQAPPGTPSLDATGLLVFPGLIDPQVHFREPGLEHKEDLASGSLCCVAGGITTFFEMPNTKPPTTDPAALEDKLRRASGRVWADHAFFLGATAENADRLGEWEGRPGCAGVKIFLGSSTGDLLVPDDPAIERVLRSGTRRVTVHSEDEPRLRERYAALSAGTSVLRHPEVRDVEVAVRATRRLLALVEKTRRPVHVLHVSTAEEVQILREHDLGELVTAEATPNHLFLSAPECYEHYGRLAQMNPPVRERRHLEALRAGLADGVITCVGSDHAPHSLAEKARPYPNSPSGIPGTQTILPLLLTAVRDGWLSLPDIVRVSVRGPIRVYGIRDKDPWTIGADGDLAIVDPSITGPLALEWLRSRAGYSPFVGRELNGWPVRTIRRGRTVYADHATQGAPAGAAVSFLL